MTRPSQGHNVDGLGSLGSLGGWGNPPPRFHRVPSRPSSPAPAASCTTGRRSAARWKTSTRQETLGTHGAWDILWQIGDSKNTTKSDNIDVSQLYLHVFPLIGMGLTTKRGLNMAATDPPLRIEVLASSRWTRTKRTSTSTWKICFPRSNRRPEAGRSETCYFPPKTGWMILPSNRCFEMGLWWSMIRGNFWPQFIVDKNIRQICSSDLSSQAA